ncbi:MAG: hypothetical protein HY078_16140 [Elusimicrobia bacterium]|nr:hypothetical protein [Elusimicrobiota bacterium]
MNRPYARTTAVVALLLCARLSPAAVRPCDGGDCPALGQLHNAAGISAVAAGTNDAPGARQLSDAAFGESRDPSGALVQAGAFQRTAQVPNLTATAPAPAAPERPATPAPSGEREGDKKNEGFKPPLWAIYGGAAIIGGIGGFLSGGVIGAVIGAGTALGSTWLWEQRDYGASIGMTAGAMLGGLLGGPILGSLIGAVAGGIIGHFVGKIVGMFLGNSR